MQLARKWFAHPAWQRSRVAWSRYRRRFEFDRAMGRALDPERGAPDGTLVEQIIRGWGDPTLPPNDPFLWSCIDEVSRSRGPILQLGSGLATLVLAVFAQRGGRPLWVLEHNRHWAHTVRAQLEEYDVTSVHMITAPLVHDGKRIWYGIDADRLPRQFGLAICDGDSVAPTGYVGVLTKLLGRMAPGAVIVVRNVHRERDVKNLVTWAKANGASSFLRKADEPYVKLVLRTGEGRSPADYSVRHSLSTPPPIPERVAQLRR
jgi:predicted O-methyltransferase YrrM